MTPPDPRIDAYIAKSAEFARPILSHLRAVVQAACPEVEETLKWGAPSFTYRGKILCGMAAFKQHAAFGFWQGAQVTGSGSEAGGEGMGQFGKLTRLSDLPGKRELTGYIRQAMALIDSGAKRPAFRGPTRRVARRAGRPAPVPAQDGQDVVSVHLLAHGPRQRGGRRLAGIQRHRRTVRQQSSWRLTIQLRGPQTKLAQPGNPFK